MGFAYGTASTSISSAPNFFKVSFFSIDWVFGMTIFRFKLYSLQTTAKPIPVLPAVPSTIVPPLEINFRLIASWTINRAALSFTDSPGLKYSAL